MIPVDPPPLPLQMGTYARLHVPVHDPPAAWKRFTRDGGAPAVEFSVLPVFTRARTLLLDPNDLPLYEPVAAGEQGADRG